MIKVGLYALAIMLSSCGPSLSTVEGSAAFAEPLTEDEAFKIAQEYDLRAYTVYATIGDGAGVVRRVPPEEGSLDVIRGSLEQLRGMKSRAHASFPHRAAVILSAIDAEKARQTAGTSSEKLEFFLRQGKAIVQRAEAEGKVQQSLQGNPAFIYGLDFVTDNDDFKRFSQTEIGKVNRGVYVPWLGRRAVSNPQVDLEAKRTPQSYMTPEEIERGLKALAEQRQ